MIKKILLVIILMQSVVLANDTDLILNEIKQLRVDMNKRFEQVDKRFEQVDKRFETVFNILYMLMGLIFVSLIIAIYLRDKKELENRRNFDIVKGMLYTLRKLAQDDEKVAKPLKAASLM